MRLLEYESKQILKNYNLSIPDGLVAESPSEVSGQLDFPVVIKAQIPLGGRGKAGGILEGNNQEDASALIRALLSEQIRGHRAKRVLVESKVDIRQEFFMAVTYDTVAKAPIAIFSNQGGVDIEELAKREPDKVCSEHFSLREGLPDYRAREMIA